jgi:hypothetical protein
VGFYENPIAGTVDVSQRGDSLFAALGKERIFLKHYHYDVFEARDIDKKGKIDTASSSFRMNFSFGTDGKIAGVSLPMDGKPLVFAFRPKAVALSKEILDKYAGDYNLGKTVVKVYLKGKTLFVSLPGQPDYETTSLGAGSFKINALTGYNLKFELNGDQAESLTFKQPNGNFKATRKK